MTAPLGAGETLQWTPEVEQAAHAFTEALLTANPTMRPATVLSLAQYALFDRGFAANIVDRDSGRSMAVALGYSVVMRFAADKTDALAMAYQIGIRLRTYIETSDMDHAPQGEALADDK